MSTARIVLAGALTFGLGVGSGWLGTRAGQPHPPAAEKPDVPESAALEAQLAALRRTNTLLVAELASVTTQARAQSPSPPKAPANSVPAPNTAQQEDPALEVDPIVAEKALVEGRALLARVIRAGQWSEQERRDWQDLLAAADRDGSRELLVARSLAINEGKIRPSPP